MSKELASTSRGEQRRQAVIDVAAELFLVHGFANTTLDMIIAQAGGSRRTIYAQFGDKEGLFAAVIIQRCKSVTANLTSGIKTELSLRDTLLTLGERFLTNLLEPTSLRLFRMLSMESAHFPELGKIFLDSGPRITHRALTDYFCQQAAKGHLSLEDPEISAMQFFALIKGGPHLIALFDEKYAISPEEIQRHVRIAVDTFLTGCEVKQKKRSR